MSTLKTFAAIILICLGGYVAICNWMCPLLAKRSGRNVSMVPIIGAMLMGVGIFLVTGSFWWSLIAILLDPGTVVLLVAAPHLTNELLSTSRYRKILSLRAKDLGREIELELFKNSIATITINYDQATMANHSLPYLTQCGLMAKWKETADGFEVYNYSDGRILTLQFVNGAYQSSEFIDLSKSENPYQLGNLEFVAQ